MRTQTVTEEIATQKIVAQRVLRTLAFAAPVQPPLPRMVASCTTAGREWNKAAFDAKVLAEALKSIGATSATDSDQIQLKAPEIAENGAIVPVEITSRIPARRRSTSSRKRTLNPSSHFRHCRRPGTLHFHPDQDGRISQDQGAGQGRGKFYVASQEVKVTIGGCGG